MNLSFKKSFTKDLKKRKTDTALLDRVRRVIAEVEDARDIHGVRNLKKLKAQGDHYRIRIGEFRLGLVIEEDMVWFVRCLHRSEVYRFFP